MKLALTTRTVSILGVMLLILLSMTIYRYPEIASELVTILSDHWSTLWTCTLKPVHDSTGFVKSYRGWGVEYPYSASVPILQNPNAGSSKEWLFVGGGEGQDDAVIGYDTDSQTLVNHINSTGLSSKSATYGGVSVDLTGDGYEDMVVAREDGLYFYERDGNRPNFTLRHKIDNPTDSRCLAVSVSDFDNTGQLKLYLSQFVQPSKLVNFQFNNPGHSKDNILLLHSVGNNWEFTDITDRHPELKGSANSFTSVFVDLSNNGRPDLVVAQDAGLVEIFRNNGRNKQFTPIESGSGYGMWMGLAVGDYDNSGRMSIFASNVSGYTPKAAVKGVGKTGIQSGQRLNNDHVLLKNNGDYNLTDQTGPELKRLPFGWGTVFEDFDLTGSVDLYMSTNYPFHPLHKYMIHPPSIMMNNGDGIFSQSFRVEQRNYGHTPVFVDLTGDGRKDMVWVNMVGKVNVYLNRSNNHYLALRLPYNIDFINSRIIITTESGRKQIREHICGGVGLTGGQSHIHSFGISLDDPVETVVIKQVNGKRVLIKNPRHDQIINVRSE